MEGIGHDRLGKNAVFFEEGIAHVEVVHALSFGKGGDVLVNIKIDFSFNIVGLFASREDAEEKDFSFGATGAHDGDDAGDAVSGLGGVLFEMSGVIGADHDDGDFGVLLIA